MNPISTVQGSYKSFIARIRDKFDDPIDLTGATIRVEVASKVTGQKVMRRNYALTFGDSAVAPASDKITIADHGLASNDKIQLTTSGVLPAGLALLTDYFVIVVDKDTIQLSLTSGGSAVDITAAAGGGTHSVPALGISFVGDAKLGKFRVIFLENATLQSKIDQLQVMEVEWTIAGVTKVKKAKNAWTVEKQSF